MSRHKRRKGDIGITFVLIVVIALGIILFGVRSFLYSKNLVGTEEEIKTYISFEEKGSMINSFLNTRSKDSDSTVAVYLASYGLDGFPREGKDLIDDTLSNLQHSLGKSSCSLSIRSSTDSFIFNENQNNQDFNIPIFSSFDSLDGVTFDVVPVDVGASCITSSYGWRSWNSLDFLFQVPLSQSIETYLLSLDKNDENAGNIIVDIFKENENFLIQKSIKFSFDDISIRKYSENDFLVTDTLNGKYYILRNQTGNLKIYLNAISWQFHKGVDFKGNGGNVYSVKRGKVIDVYDECPDLPANSCLQPLKDDHPGCDCKPNERYGNLVVIGHNEISSGEYEFYTVYYHLNDVDVKIGDVVSRRQKIGTIGNSGRSTGPHLHFGVTKYPFIMPYRIKTENFYDPCPLFAVESGIMDLEGMSGRASCTTCEAECVDNTIEAQNSEMINKCIGQGRMTATRESITYITMNGDLAVAELVCI